MRTRAIPSATPVTAPGRHRLPHLGARDAVGWLFAGWTAALTALALGLSSRTHPAPWLAGQLLLGCALVQWLVVLHECGHDTLFRTRRLNVWVGHVAGAFALIPFRAWKPVHARHHRWTGWQDVDPTTALLVPRSLSRLERAVVNACWRGWIPLFSVVYRLRNYWDFRRLRGILPPRALRAAGRDAALLAAGYAALLVALGPAQALRLAGLGLLLSLVVEDPLLLSQHTHVPQRLSGGEPVAPFPPPEQAAFTRSLRVPAWVSRGVLLNFDAHELHHMHPAVPAYRLRRLGEAPAHEVHWWRWLREAKRLPGEVFLFQDRTRSGFDL